jgi:hypothetical protein
VSCQELSVSYIHIYLAVKTVIIYYNSTYTFLGRMKLAPLLLSACFGICLANGIMGPLLNDTTIIVDECVKNPGDVNAKCADLGVFLSAEDCSAACANTSYCSSITWHGPTTGDWSGHCVAVSGQGWLLLFQ